MRLFVATLGYEFDRAFSSWAVARSAPRALPWAGIGVRRWCLRPSAGCGFLGSVTTSAFSQTAPLPCFQAPSPTESPRRSGGFSFNKLQRSCLDGLDLQEDDDEREQSEGLDERQTENQEDKDSRTCAGVTSQSLGCRASRLTLTQTAETSSQRHTQSGSQWNPLVFWVHTDALRKSRRCKQHRGQRHKQILQLLHRVTPSPVRYAASGWLMLTVLAPSRSRRCCCHEEGALHSKLNIKLCLQALALSLPVRR